LAEGDVYRHAWNVAGDGTVVDQTWTEPESKSYLGVQLDDATMEAWADWHQGTGGVLTPHGVGSDHGLAYHSRDGRRAPAAMKEGLDNS
jgi:hypothetical protein